MRSWPLLLLILAAAPAAASHDWIGLDLCRQYPERMPPELDPTLLPQPDSCGATLLGHYCGQCHFAPGPGQHTAAEWSEVIPRMALVAQVTARFGGLVRAVEVPTPAEQEVLLAYLQEHALRPLADEGAAPAAYRALCGDCHAAPDPAAYPGVDWPVLLARMTDHRGVMGRGTADPAGAAQVRVFLSVPYFADDGGDTVSGTNASGYGRWLALGPFLALVFLGLGRWLLTAGKGL